MSESFAELFEQSLSQSQMVPGSIVMGKVVDIRGDSVVVNAGAPDRIQVLVPGEVADPGSVTGKTAAAPTTTSTEPPQATTTTLAAGLLQFAAAGEGLVQPLLGVAVVYGAGQVIESFVLTPRLVGERIGLHPLGVILALMVFGQWLGFWGLLIALPCAACLTVVGRQVLNHWRQSESFSRVS